MVESVKKSRLRFELTVDAGFETNEEHNLTKTLSKNTYCSCCVEKRILQTQIEKEKMKPNRLFFTFCLEQKLCINFLAILLPKLLADTFV